MRRLALLLALAAAATACAGAPGVTGGDGGSVAAGPTVRIEIEEPSTTTASTTASTAVASTAATTAATPTVVASALAAEPDRAASDAGSSDPAPSAGSGVTAPSAPTSLRSPTSAPTALTATSTPGPAPVASSSAPSVVAHAVVDTVVARVAPDGGAAPVAELAHPTPIGSPLVFRVVDGSRSVAGWLQVQLPVEPNGTTGWVRRDDVTLFENPYRVEIDRAAHRLRVYRLGELRVDTLIAVGTGATPTPVGEFYLIELLAPPDPTGPYGPYAFGLSGFSDVLDSFGGADSAIIGIHGTDDPSALGTDASFGCIRLANDVIEDLAATLPLGTPVVIV